MEIIGVCFVLAFFFTLYAIAYVWLWMTSKDEEKRLLTPKKLAFGFLMLYVALAHLSVASGLAYSVERDKIPACENLINQTRETYIYGDNYTGYHWDYTGTEPLPAQSDTNLFHKNTTYTYFNSCAATAAPISLSILYVLTTYLIYGGLVFLFIGAIYFVFRLLAGNTW